jgi:protocatechuate 3,4-dioxygenase beta subunit
LTATDFAGLGTCVLLPEKTSGPFPLDEQFDRRDITEGVDGHPLRLGLRVLDGSCTPVPGAAVEIWHTDATGDYSAFVDGGGGKDEGPGSTFCRGTQTANDEGIVEFLTVYPGWYTGRAVHVHLRVHLDGATVLTSQLFFDEAYTESVYASAPYAEFGLPDTSNAADNIAGDPEAEGTIVSTVAADTANGRGTLGLLKRARSGSGPRSPTSPPAIPLRSPRWRRPSRRRPAAVSCSASGGAIPPCSTSVARPSRSTRSPSGPRSSTAT